VSATQHAKEYTDSLRPTPGQSVRDYADTLYTGQSEVYRSYIGSPYEPFASLRRNVQAGWLRYARRRMRYWRQKAKFRRDDGEHSK